MHFRREYYLHLQGKTGQFMDCFTLKMQVCSLEF